MWSRARLLPFPLHAPLGAVPLGLLLGAFALDLAARWLGREELWTAAAHLAWAGVFAGVLAAVPGVVDYARRVPAGAPKRRARRHALANVAALALFALARWVRGDAAVPPDPPILFVEGLGSALLLAGAWTGSTLVYRDGVGVHPPPRDGGAA